MFENDLAITVAIRRARDGSEFYQLLIYSHCETLARVINFAFKSSCYRYGVSDDDLNFILNDVVLYILKDKNMDVYTDFRAYFTVTYRYRVLAFIEKKKSQAKKVISMSDFEDFESRKIQNKEYPVGIIDVPFGNEFFNIVIKKLPLFEREVIVMYLKGYSLSEISKMFKIAYSSIHRFYENAIKRMQKFADENNIKP